MNAPNFDTLCDVAGKIGATTDYLLGIVAFPYRDAEHKDAVINDMDAEIRRLKKKLRQITQIIDD